MVTAIWSESPAVTNAEWTPCIAGRRLSVREESLRAKISLPMVMQVMFVAGRYGVTFCLIHAKALEGSFILERYSLPSPTMNSTPVPENALRICGFAS